MRCGLGFLVCRIELPLKPIDPIGRRFEFGFSDELRDCFLEVPYIFLKACGSGSRVLRSVTCVGQLHIDANVSHRSTSNETPESDDNFPPVLCNERADDLMQPSPQCAPLA